MRPPSTAKYLLAVSVALAAAGIAPLPLVLAALMGLEGVYLDIALGHFLTLVPPIWILQAIVIAVTDWRRLPLGAMMLAALATPLGTLLYAVPGLLWLSGHIHETLWPDRPSTAALLFGLKALLCGVVVGIITTLYVIAFRASNESPRRRSAA